MQTATAKAKGGAAADAAAEAARASARAVREAEAAAGRAASIAKMNQAHAALGGAAQAAARAAQAAASLLPVPIMFFKIAMVGAAPLQNTPPVARICPNFLFSVVCINFLLPVFF